jgi:hypothetical protein
MLRSSSGGDFKVSGFILRFLIHFELIFAQSERDVVSFFYMWISSFLVCWTGRLFSNVCFWNLCQNSDGCNCVNLLLDSLFYSCVLAGSCYLRYGSLSQFSRKSSILLCHHRPSGLMSKGWAPRTKGSHLIHPCKQVTEAIKFKKQGLTHIWLHAIL